MATYVFNTFKEGLMEGLFNLLEAATGYEIKLMAVTAFSHETGTTADKDITFVSGLTFTEFAGTGYTAGHGNRINLTSKTVTMDTAGDEGVFDNNDIALGVLGIAGTIIGFVLIKEIDAGSDATAVPIAYLDTTNYAPDGIATVTLAFDAEGIINLT